MPSTRQLDQNQPSIELDRAQIPNLDLAPLFGEDGPAREALVEDIRMAELND